MSNPSFSEATILFRIQLIKVPETETQWYINKKQFQTMQQLWQFNRKAAIKVIFDGVPMTAPPPVPPPAPVASQVTQVYMLYIG